MYALLYIACLNFVGEYFRRDHIFFVMRLLCVMLILRWVGQQRRFFSARPLGVCLFFAVVAHGGIPKVSTYSVSKAALNASTKMHAYELKSARIRCADTHFEALGCITYI